MDWDELKPRPAKAITVGEDLKPVGIAELEARVATLEAEIARVEAEISAKKAHEQAAAEIFKR